MHRLVHLLGMGRDYRLRWRYDGEGAVLEEKRETGWQAVEQGNLRERFPISIYSQKQINELAANLRGLLEVVDRSPQVDRPAWDRLWEDVKSRCLVSLPSGQCGSLQCSGGRIPAEGKPDQFISVRGIIRIDIPKSLYVHQSPNGYFHRVGSAKRQMPPDILARLFQQRSQARLIRFDEQAVATAGPDVLEKVLWNKFKSPLSPGNDEEFLLKLNLLTQDAEGNICPSVSGILMACPAPETYVTNAYIQAVAYRGTLRNADYQTDARDITGQCCGTQGLFHPGFQNSPSSVFRQTGIIFTRNHPQYHDD